MVKGSTQRTTNGRLNEGLLRIYLRDHHAASVGGTELARRTLANNRGTPLGQPWRSWPRTSMRTG
jgi:hypothetical protein